MTSHEPIEATEKLFTRTQPRASRDWIRVIFYSLILSSFVLLMVTHRLDRFEALVRDGFLKASSWGLADSRPLGHPGIVLIEITETALEEIGPWPWPRSYHAILARLLSEWKAAALVFDLNLSEPLNDKNDADLAQTLSGIEAPFYLPVDLKPQKEKKFWVHGMPVVLEEGGLRKNWVHVLPEFEKKARGLGHSDLAPDADGVLRRFDPFLIEGKESHLFLPLRVAFDQRKNPVPLPQEWASFQDSEGKVIIPWNEKWDQAFTRYSYADLIHSFYAIQKGSRPVIDPGKLAGKICLIGPVVSGASELSITPINIKYPRIAVYAQVLNAALTGNWIKPVPFWGNILCLLGIGGLTLLFFIMLRGAWPLVAGLLLAAGWVAFCFMAFSLWHLWFFAVYPVLLMFCLFIFSAIHVQMAATREKSHLFHLATRDGLTELYVIRHFRLIMNQIVREASVRKEPLSVILFDLDYFKKINDTYGHPAGDMVLKKTAALILSFIRKRRPFREIDFAARYGGEEFILMLRKAGLQEAATVAAERIRKKVEETEFIWEGKRIPVTISLGVATLHPGENVPDPMVHRADVALYKAKEAGRNRVCMEGR